MSSRPSSPNVSRVSATRWGLLLLCGAALPLAAQANSVTVLSSRAFLEPNSSKAGDKDGCPPVNSSADPEEFTLQAKIVVTSAILNPTVQLADDNNPGGVEKRTRDDLTLDEFSATNGAAVAGGTRDIDMLDGADDGYLAPGTYYTYFNLDKTGYNQETLANCAGNSITGDRDKYTVALHRDGVAVTSGSLNTVAEPSTSIDQNDLDWLDTQPALNFAEPGENFCIRTKYRQSSANSVDYLTAHIYHHADRIQLDSVDLYYYNTDGSDPGSIEDGVPGVSTTGTTPTQSYYDTVYFSPTGTALPSTQTTGDHWVAEYCFTVVGEGSSRFIPYFMTQQSGTTGTWKIDSGYEGWNSEPPPINPPVLELYKTCDASVPSLTGGSTQTVTETLEVCNTGNGGAVDVVLVDSLPLDPNVVYSSSTGGGVFDTATSTVEWSIGAMAADTCQSFDLNLIVTPDALDTSIDTNAGATVEGGMEIDPTVSVSDSTTETCTIPVNPSYPTLSMNKAATGYTDSDGNGTLSPGDTVYYSISYSNTGTGAASGVVISDNPDETYVANISGLTGGSYNGNTVTWSVGSVAAGASGSVSYSASLQGPGAFGHGTTTVLNTATLTATNHSTLTDAESVAVAAATALTLEKSATGYADTDGNGVLSPGDTVYYQLAYANTGNADATTVLVYDDIDETLVDAVGAISDGGLWDGDQLGWSLGTVGAGDSGILTYEVTVAAAGAFADGSTDLVNIASIESHELGPVSDTETVVVQAYAALAIDKVVTGYTDADGDGSLSPGDFVSYSVTVTNTGNADATGVSLGDDYDQSYVVSTSSTGTDNGDSISWSLGTLVPGASSSVSYTATLRGAGAFLHGSTAVNNTATADSDQTGGVSDSASVIVGAAASLSVAKSATSWNDLDADGVLSPGDLVNYTVSYQNSGNAAATGVTLVDNPDEAYVSFVDSVDGAWDGDTVSWSLGTLAAGASGSVSYTVTLADAGAFAHGDTEVLNLVVIDSNETGPDSDTELVTVSASASLDIDKVSTGYTDTDGNGVLSPGDTVHYTVSYQNTGNASATGVTLTDTPELSAVGAITNITGGGGYDGASISWTLGTVAAAGSGSVSYDLVLAAAGAFVHGSTPVANTAVVNSPETGPSYDDESVTVVAAASLAVAKSATGYSDVDGNGVLSPGDLVNYSVSYANTGNATANSVTLVDDPDEAGVQSVEDITGGGAYDGDTVSWNLGSLAPGETGSVSYTAVILGNGYFADGNTPVDNYVVLSSAETGPATDSDTVTVTAGAAITVDKAVVGTTDVDGDGLLSPGDVVHYSLTIANPANADATGVSFVDSPETAYIASIGNISHGGSYDGTTINWSVGTVPTGSTFTVTYDVTLAGAGAFADGTTPVGNTVVVDSNETPPASDTDSIDVVAAASLTLTASVAGYTDNDGNGVLSPGDAVTWQLDYANVGNAASTGTTLVDSGESPWVATVDSASGGGLLSGLDISWDLGTLDVGETGSVGWTGTLAGAGTFPAGSTSVTDGATLDSNETAPVSDAAATVVTAYADLAVTKSSTGYADNDGNGALSPGDTVHYAVTYANTGNASAHGVSVSDDPDETALASVGNISGGGAYNGNTIDWSLGTVTPGSGDTLTYDVSLGSAGTFADGTTAVHNVVVVDSDETDPETDDETVTVTADAALVVAKTATGFADNDGNGVLSPGDDVSYVIDYQNAGDAAASGVLLTDDPDATWVDGVSGITGGGSYDGDTLSWSLGTLAPGASGGVSYVVTLAAAGVFPDGVTPVDNVAVLSSNEDGPVSDDETVDVDAAPILVPSKSVSSTSAITQTFANSLSAWSNEAAAVTSSAAVSTVTTSTRIVYTLSVANTGTATASGVTLEDALPSGTSLESATGSYTSAGGVITWTVADLAPGAAETVTLSVTTD